MPEAGIGWCATRTTSWCSGDQGRGRAALEREREWTVRAGLTCIRSKHELCDERPGGFEFSDIALTGQEMTLVQRVRRSSERDPDQDAKHQRPEAKDTIGD